MKSDAIYMDFYKAFDIVPHCSLVSKLERQDLADGPHGEQGIVWMVTLKSGDQWLQRNFSKGHEGIGWGQDYIRD